MRASVFMLALCALTSVVACDKDETTSDPGATPSASANAAEIVTPPFAMRGDLSGLMLVWFDEEGPHIAATRDEIPAARRERVRVDSLSLSPEQRLDPNYVYLADLRNTGPNGSYVVRKLPRERFDALIDEATHVAVAANLAGGGNPNAGVVIYGASWCGACHQAAAFLRANHVDFVEKDIERDPSARAEMQAKCTAAGLHPNGIPVIDFRGQMLMGFDEGRMRQLIAQQPPVVPAPPPSAAPPSAAPPNVQVI